MPADYEAYEVRVTETAWEMLATHVRFLANVSKKAANTLIDSFAERTAGLAEMPEAYPWLDDERIPFQKYRKLLFSKYHMALYEIRGNIVYVTAVVDCRQDYAWLLL
jgi:plasmid stabilization system protein ParE